MVNSRHSLKSQENIIATQQTGAAVVTPAVSDAVAMELERIEAWHLAQAIPVQPGPLYLTPEQQAEYEAIIIAEEVQR